MESPVVVCVRGEDTERRRIGFSPPTLLSTWPIRSLMSRIKHVTFLLRGSIKQCDLYNDACFHSLVNSLKRLRVISVSCYMCEIKDRRVRKGRAGGARGKWIEKGGICARSEMNSIKNRAKQ